MSKKTLTIQTVGSSAMTELCYHVEEATSAMQKTCAHALCAGLRLIHLHKESAHEVGGNLGVTHDTPSGFKAAIEAVGLNRRTAYRWMNAAVNALLQEGIEEAEILACEASHWGEWDKRLVELAGRTSLRRLTLGAERAGTEDHRLETLIEKAEHGDHGAEDLLEKVSEGKLTLVQAIRAAAGAEATKGKERTDPVYFALDMKTGELRGLFPKVLITMKNALLQWPSAGEAERRKAREAWKALVAELPAEFLK